MDRGIATQCLLAAALLGGTVWLEAVRPLGEGLEIRVEPPAPLDGQTVRVEAAARDGAFCEFNGHRFPFYPIGGGRSRALVPVPFWLGPGDRPMVALDPGPVGSRGVRSGFSLLEVRPRELPLRRISIPRAKFKLFKDPRVPEARRRFLEALQTRTPEHGWSGRFAVPVDGRVSSPFGSPRQLGGGRRYVHKGLDVAAPLGTPVRAPNAGVVLLASEFPLQSRMVVIDHGHGVISIVQHLLEVKTRAGDRVEKGALVGRVGSEGISTGAHVHCGMYVHGEPVDPEEWTLRDF